MTPERAEEIRMAIWREHGWTRGGATEEEYREILREWESMPGDASYYSAVCHLVGRLAKNEKPVRDFEPAIDQARIEAAR